jgi:two-component system LytT family sensor kinase
MATTRAVSYKHLLFLIACIWFGIVLFMGLRIVSGTLTERDFTPAFFGPIRFLTLYFLLPWLLFAPLVATLATSLPIRPEQWLWPLCANILLFLAIAMAHSLGIAYFYHYFGDVTGPMAAYAPWQHSGHFLFGDNLFLFEVITYSVLAANLNMGNFHQIVQRQELDAARLRETLAELRLQTLRMQINPHFLFNSLNAVTVLVQKREPERAVETINRLASFFRRTLEGASDQWVSLAGELEMIDEYLDIAKVRFGDRLQVIEECEPQAKSVQVPAMLLQPLIENAVMHGVSEKPGRCTVTVQCRIARERLTIEITDDGAGCARGDPRFKEGTGLTNVRLRLQQLYGDNHTFALESRPGHGTRVTISVPAAIRYEPQAAATA